MINHKIDDCIIYIIDNDIELLKSMKWLLQSVPFNVKTYDTADAFLNDIDHNSLGCIITDLRMPGMNGLELQQILKNRGIDLPVILMTAYGQVGLAVGAMKQGIVDFIEKPFNDQYLIDAINSGLRRALQNADDRDKIADICQKFERLTDRESQICQLVVDGHTNKDISVLLNISIKTVETHRGQMMNKLGTDSLASLIHMVLFIKNTKDNGLAKG